MPKLVFDIDGVIANFSQGVIDYYHDIGEPLDICCHQHVKSYQFFPAGFWKDYPGIGFWLGLKRMPGARRMMLQGNMFPDMYLTARPVSSDTTLSWLKLHGFPLAKVVTVKDADQKIKFLEKGDILIDDLPSTVRAAQAKGVMALLLDAPFHRGVPLAELAGLARIEKLSDAADFVPYLNSLRV